MCTGIYLHCALEHELKKHTLKTKYSYIVHNDRDGQHANPGDQKEDVYVESALHKVYIQNCTLCLDLLHQGLT